MDNIKSVLIVPSLADRGPMRLHVRLHLLARRARTCVVGLVVELILRRSRRIDRRRALVAHADQANSSGTCIYRGDNPLATGHHHQVFRRHLTAHVLRITRLNARRGRRSASWRSLRHHSQRQRNNSNGNQCKERKHSHRHSLFIYLVLLARGSRTAAAGATTATSPASTTTTTTAAAAAPATEARVRLRIDDQAIEEEVDRVRHNLDSIECAVVERVSGALDKREGRGYTGGVELIEEVHARRHRYRCVGRAVDEDGRREVRSNVCRG